MGDSNVRTMDVVEIEQTKNRIKETILTNILPDAVSQSASKDTKPAIQKFTANDAKRN